MALNEQLISAGFDFFDVCEEKGFSEEDQDFWCSFLISEMSEQKYGNRWEALKQFTEILRESSLGDEKKLTNTVLVMVGLREPDVEYD